MNRLVNGYEFHGERLYFKGNNDEYEIHALIRKENEELFYILINDDQISSEDGSLVLNNGKYDVIIDSPMLIDFFNKEYEKCSVSIDLKDGKLIFKIDLEQSFIDELACPLYLRLKMRERYYNHVELEELEEDEIEVDNLHINLSSRIKKLILEDERNLKDYFNIEALYLSGSIARGEEKAHSSIDLIVVIENSDDEEMNRAIRKHICNKYKEVLSRYIDVNIVSTIDTIKNFEELERIF